MMLGDSLRQKPVAPTMLLGDSLRQVGHSFSAPPTTFRNLGGNEGKVQCASIETKETRACPRVTFPSANSQQVLIEFPFNDMQKMIVEIKESQDRQEQRLTNLIVENTRSANIETGNSGNRGMRNFIESCESRLDTILHKVERLEEKNSQVVQNYMAVAEVKHTVREEVDVKGGLPAPAGVRINIDDLHMTKNNIKTDGTPDVASHGDHDISQAEGFSKHFTSDWSAFKQELKRRDEKKSIMYRDVVEMSRRRKSVWHLLSEYSGLESYLATEAPESVFAKVVYHPIFIFASGALVMANVFFVGYETDVGIKVALQIPGAQEQDWAYTIEIVFDIVFAAELVFKIMSLRTWFFVAPGEWAWNMLDLIVVVWSFLSEVLTGVKLTFMRSLRFVRAVRAVRIIRVLRIFRELRRMLMSLLSGVRSLFWVFLFLAMVMYMVSILLLQGLAGALDSHGNSAQYDDDKIRISTWYGSLGRAMMTLLLAITGGYDWYELYVPLEIAGFGIQMVFVLFVQMVLIGLMHILTGIFLQSIDEIADPDLVIQDYHVKVEGFVRMMMDLFAELDENASGALDWNKFREALSNDRVQAYMAANGLSTLQSGLIFDLLDVKHTGKIELADFVLGMSRLKGYATAVDVEVIMKAIGMIPRLVHNNVVIEPDEKVV